MNKYRSFVSVVLILEILLALACNGLYIAGERSEGGRMYRVEANRAAMELEKHAFPEDELADMDLSAYESIVRISRFDAGEACNNDYVVKEVNGVLYRIEYRTERDFYGLFCINATLFVMMFITGIVLFYVHKKVLKPFHAMSSLSYELAKGNLSAPVKEEKSKLFGRFLWGMDMLREKLEDNKEKELEFQRERKTLILSLSHDIKTPLSSIDLYARALSGGLYETQEKRDEALSGITRNVREIKKYVDEIVTASREDFLNLEVFSGEFYLSEVIRTTEDYYRDKLSVIHTRMDVERFSDCLLKGDKNRLIEVLQNIMENAVKYGDGDFIKIRCGEEEDCKLIQIENSGCSLQVEELPNLFDSFYRGSNSHGIKGNGLGLYICKSLMHKMDGEIYAQVKKGIFCVTVVVRKA
mgnify:CR=1 FL=1